GPGNLVTLHVDGVPIGPAPRARDFAVLEGEGAGVLVRPENPVRGTILDDAVAHDDAVRLAEDAGAAAAAHVETLEHHVAGLLELDRVLAAAQHWPGRPGIASPADDHRGSFRTAIVGAHHHATGVLGPTVHFDDVTGL